jgi:glycosyltransferase involved in cell wall biosynthesis
MLSVIIPAKNEIYLERTIRNILENAEGEIEVIAELDG